MKFSWFWLKNIGIFANKFMMRYSVARGDNYVGQAEVSDKIFEVFENY